MTFLTDEQKAELGRLAAFMNGESFLISPTTVTALLEENKALAEELANYKRQHCRQCGAPRITGGPGEYIP